MPLYTPDLWVLHVEIRSLVNFHIYNVFVQPILYKNSLHKKFHMATKPVFKVNISCCLMLWVVSISSAII